MMGANRLFDLPEFISESFVQYRQGSIEEWIMEDRLSGAIGMIQGLLQA